MYFVARVAKETKDIVFPVGELPQKYLIYLTDYSLKMADTHHLTGSVSMTNAIKKPSFYSTSSLQISNPYLSSNYYYEKIMNNSNVIFGEMTWTWKPHEDGNINGPE